MYVRSNHGGRRGCFFDLTPCCITTYVRSEGANDRTLPRPGGEKTDVQFRDTFAEQTAGRCRRPTVGRRGIWGGHFLYGHAPHKPHVFARNTRGRNWKSELAHPEGVPVGLDLRLVAGRSWAIARRREIADRGRP